MFINTVLQNPSGTSLSAASAFRVLQIADREGIWIVEDDISRELAPPGAPCLAAMEGLQRVIYVSGFSKTITPAMRVGYIAAHRELLSRFAMTKMAVGLTSSEITERAVASVLIEGHYDRHTAFIRERLFNAHAKVTASMLDAGLEIFHTPNAGLFLWARLPILPDASIAVANEALGQGIWLAPGSYFRPGEHASNWFRFNATTSDAPKLWAFLETLQQRIAQFSRSRLRGAEQTDSFAGPFPFCERRVRRAPILETQSTFQGNSIQFCVVKQYSVAAQFVLSSECAIPNH